MRSLGHSVAEIKPYPYATIESDGWALEDFIELSRALTELVNVLPESDRSGLKVSDLAQLTFLFPGESEEPSKEESDVQMIYGENMWVTVDEVIPYGESLRYVGTLVSSPVLSDSIDVGTKVVFGPEHVRSLYEEWEGEAQAE